MAIKVRSRWRLLALTTGLVLLGIMVPAQAAEPLVVNGNSDCASVGWVGESLTITEPFKKGTQSGTVGGVTISLDALGRTGFDFSIEGGVVYDVVVKGSAAHWYHYEGGTIKEEVAGPDFALNTPNGNKLNVVHFCYIPGEGLECGGEVTTVADPNASGTFIRNDSATCSGVKLVVIEVRGNSVAFIPTGGSEDSTYTGVITFRKVSTADYPEGFALRYDPEDDGSYKLVLDCVNGVPPGTERWCLVSATSSYQTGQVWLFTWNVKGVGDPLFK